MGEDECQATVGSSRGKWAKELVDETKKAIMNCIKECPEEKEKAEKKETNGEFDDPRRVLSSSSFRYPISMTFSASRTEGTPSDEKC